MIFCSALRQAQKWLTTDGRSGVPNAIIYLAGGMFVNLIHTILMYVFVHVL